MELVEEKYTVAGWNVDVDYNSKKIIVKFGSDGTEFYLRYDTHDDECWLKEFMEFLAFIRCRFIGFEKPVVYTRECQEE